MLRHLLKATCNNRVGINIHFKASLAWEAFLFPHHSTIKVAANEVSNHDAHVEHRHIHDVCRQEVQWHAEVIESVSHAVRKAAHFFVVLFCAAKLRIREQNTKFIADFLRKALNVISLCHILFHPFCRSHADEFLEVTIERLFVCKSRFVGYQR